MELSRWTNIRWWFIFLLVKHLKECMPLIILFLNLLAHSILRSLHWNLRFFCQPWTFSQRFFRSLIISLMERCSVTCSPRINLFFLSEYLTEDCTYLLNSIEVYLANASVGLLSIRWPNLHEVPKVIFITLLLQQFPYLYLYKFKLVTEGKEAVENF